MEMKQDERWCNKKVSSSKQSRVQSRVIITRLLRGNDCVLPVNQFWLPVVPDFSIPHFLGLP